jgi:hypothetical protein
MGWSKGKEEKGKGKKMGKEGEDGKGRRKIRKREIEGERGRRKGKGEENGKNGMIQKGGLNKLLVQ